MSEYVAKQTRLEVVPGEGGGKNGLFRLCGACRTAQIKNLIPKSCTERTKLNCRVLDVKGAQRDIKKKKKGGCHCPRFILDFFFFLGLTPQEVNTIDPFHSNSTKMQFSGLECYMNSPLMYGDGLEK